MTAYKNKKPIGQVTEILHEQRLYTEAEIREALKKVPAKTKKRKRGQ